MERLFLKIYDYLRTRRALMWGLLAVTVVVPLILACGLKFKEDVTDFLPMDKENQDICWAFSHLGPDNKIVISISGRNGQDNWFLMDVVDTLENKIDGIVPEGYIRNAIYRADASVMTSLTDFIVGNLPYYLTEDDYQKLDSLIAKGSVNQELEAAKQLAISPAGVLMRGVVTKDPLLLSADRLKSLEQFSQSSSFRTVDDYIFSEDGAAIVTLDLAFSSSDTRSAGKFLKLLDRAVAETEASFDGEVAVDPLGSVFIAETNSSQIKKDSIISILIAIILIAVLLISFFHSGKYILLVGVTIAYGFVLAMGVMSFAADGLSLIVIGMGAVIIGIAANYPLHFLTHISQGTSPRDSLSDIVIPLTTGNITTVGAFLSLMFIASPSMKGFGLFAAVLLIGTILFTLVFLPHLVKEHSAAKEPAPIWNKFSSLGLGSNRIVLLAVVVITIFLSFFQNRVVFDSNLHNINYMTRRQQENMDRMLNLAQGARSVSYVVMPGKDIDEAMDAYLEVSDRIDGLASAIPGAAVTSVHDFIPSRSLQEQRLRRWNAFTAENADDLVAMVNSAARKAGFVEDAFAPFEAMLQKEYKVEPVEYFSTITDNIAAGRLIFDKDRCGIVSAVGTDDNATAAIQEAMADTQAIVFDSSTMTANMVNSLSREFDFVLYVCAFIVFLLLVISFGRLELAGIAFIPLTIGWIWILGIMGLCNIDFNIINIILATFIFGMGDDYTIFITEGVMAEYAYGKQKLRTYERTIILSALIMFVGIGALIVAKHPAMRSLAYVIMIGMLCVVLMADILPPFIFRWLTYKKGRKRQEPITLLNFGATVLAFIAFLIGATIITLSGFFLITLTFGSAKGKEIYHKFLCKVSGFVFNNVFFTKHTVERADTLDKPAIIVANHQSHLDLMAMLMLTPKMVVVTNKWVWNNPLYGILIRYADFCPVENVLSDDLSHLEKMIAQGYSVLVFPEGTRTVDGSIGRFHRGSFYLAEKYGLDIVPVVLHGLNDVLPKVDLLLRKGHMTVRVMPRIKAGDPILGADYREATRNVRHLMIDEFGRIAKQVEDVDYFSNRVFHNYIYKGKEVGRAVRKSLKENDNYRDLVAAMPETGRVLMVNPLYGEPALICSLVRKELAVDVLMEDNTNMLLASNCAGVPENMKFVQDAEFGVYDIKVVFGSNGYTIEGNGSKV